MPVTLRRRLQCHYCGKRLNTASRSGNNKIKCDGCLADNFFDDDNNIVDVPASVASQPSRLSSLPEIESESSIFCRTCLTNQSFYVRALADYLPDEDDPRYKEFEDALPTFKKELDLRYPRCCAQCEPRVQAQIQQANYNAKTDHLRRMMHRTYHRRPQTRLDMRSLVISVAGLGHGYSLATQLFWHTLASQAHSDSYLPGLTPRQCMRQWPVPVQCADYAASLVPMSLVSGFLCIWWNPHWQQRLKGREGRLTGLRRYYLTQMVILALRFLVWVFARNLSATQQHTVHALTLVAITMLSVYSYFGTIRVDTTPLVDWSKVQRPLVDPNQFRPPAYARDSPPATQSSSHFPIESLAGPPRRPLEPWRPPTPPSSADNMDWTPTALDFNPQPRQPKQKFEQPSPFYGTLPAAPTRGSLDPKRPDPPPQKKALGLAPGFFGLSKPSNAPDQIPTQPVGSTFAPAKFFAHERDADTGLENIFDKMFSVRDPLEVPVPKRTPTAGQDKVDVFGQSRRKSMSHHAPRHAQQSGQRTARLVLSCIIIVVLAAVASSLCALEIMHGETAVAASTVLPYTALIPLSHTLEELACIGQPTAARMTATLLELTIPVAAYVLLPATGSPFVPSWNKVVIGMVFLFMLREVYLFCQLQSTPVTSAATAQMVHSMERAEREVPQVPRDASPRPHSSPPHSQPYPSPLQSSAPPVNSFQSQHPLPSQAQQRQPNSRVADYSTIRKRDSDESISSISSIQTASTASGWKTPKHDDRTFDWQNRSTRRASTNISHGLGGLSLGNEFGTGAGIAGPRTRPAQGNAFGKYR